MGTIQRFLSFFTNVFKGIVNSHKFLFQKKNSILHAIYVIILLWIAYFTMRLYFDEKYYGSTLNSFNSTLLAIFHQYFNILLVFESPKSWQTPILPIEELFPNYKLLQDNWHTIRDEALNVLHDENLIKPSTFYSTHIAGLVRYSERTSNHKDPWKWAMLRFYGDEYPDAMSKCPKTAEIIRQLPEMDLVMFSIMDAGTTLPVHRGFFRGVTRLLFPLIVPGYDYNGRKLVDVSNATYPERLAPKSFLTHKNLTTNRDPTVKECKIVIGEDLSYHFGKHRGSKLTPMVKTHSSYYSHPTVAHYFEPGVPILWDDTYAHSVSNHLDSPRVVLLADIRRPKPPNALGIGQMFFDFCMRFGLVQYFYLQNSKQEKVVHNLGGNTNTTSNKTYRKMRALG